MEEKTLVPLNILRVHKLATAVNRAHTLLHCFLVSLFLYNRLFYLFLIPAQDDAVLTPSHRPPPLLPSLLLFAAELILSVLWLSGRVFRWRPVERVVFVDRLPADTRLPAVDVFICTADPDKEPTVEVMNTVVSAMCLDYPSDKLHVYLSDDGASHVTLNAIKEAWGFATWWVPFCKRYGVKCRCPMAYFRHGTNDNVGLTSAEFIRDRSLLKEKYELFKERVEVSLFEEKMRARDKNNSRNNHPPIVQVINQKCTDPLIINPDYSDIPLLVYVAREKRPSYPHHFKAGALNALLRVSGLLSNSPIVLVLDCDMYCNDPTSAKQAMCFYLDPQISSSLGFVQFPQRFHNLSKHHMYDDDFRFLFKELLPGIDRLGAGPNMCGTGFYLNRKALLNNSLDPVELSNKFAPSTELMKTQGQDVKLNKSNPEENSQKIEFLASCAYEDETKWGDGLGFYYYSVAEDAFTGYHLHIRGWKSVYMNPERASFLGSSTTNLNDLLIQNTRWAAGLVEIGLSKFCPFFYGPSRRNLSLLHRICCTWVNLFPMAFMPIWCLAIIPQICLLHGIPLYSKDSNPTFPLLATLIFLSSQIKHLHEVLTTGGTTASWWTEQTMWILKMLTCYTYGCMDGVMKILGLKNTSFIPTNKVEDEDQVKRYHQGIYDFQTSNMFLVPLGTTVILNLVSFFGGLARMVVVENWDEMALQCALSGFFLVMSKPVIEGMVLRKDKGRFPTSATLRSLVVCLVILNLGPFVILH